MQLTIAIRFLSSKLNEEDRLMHSKSNDVKITINDKEDDVIEKHLQSVFPNVILGWKHQLKVVISYLIVVVYSLVNVVKYILNSVMINRFP